MPTDQPKPPTTPNPDDGAASSLRLGTRGSALARWQADWVTARLAEHGVQVEIVLITTTGDTTSTPITAAASQGVFTKEIQRALLDQRVDIAVHSLKDLPTEHVEGLTLGAVPPRERIGDALVSNAVATLEELPQGARVGTGSRRRRSQLLHARPDLDVLDIRGNVDTRLKKLDDGEYDAIILAEAGLRRLELGSRIRQVLPPAIMLPAVGQGALGIEIRDQDERARAAVQLLDDFATHRSVIAERTMLAELRGGCLAPVGAWSRVEGDSLTLDGVVLSNDGQQRIAASANGPLESSEELGREVAVALIDQGATELIASARE